MTSCYLCQSRSHSLVHPRTRDRADIKVLRCESCGFVFLDRTDHTRGDFYEGAGMFDGAMPAIDAKLAEERDDTRRRVSALREAVRGKRYLDFGCGLGAALAELKHEAAAVAGVEPNQKMREYVRGKGIAMFESLEKIEGHYDVISLFHVLEHLEDPRVTLKKLSGHLVPGGFLFVEVPSADDALLKLYDCASFKDFTYWSCHLYLFTPKTMAVFTEQCGLKLRALEQVQRYPLANHLRWLAEGKPGGHETWKHLRDPAAEATYAELLARQGACDTIVARMSL